MWITCKHWVSHQLVTTCLSIMWHHISLSIKARENMKTILQLLIDITFFSAYAIPILFQDDEVANLCSNPQITLKIGIIICTFLFFPPIIYLIFTIAHFIIACYFFRPFMYKTRCLLAALDYQMHKDRGLLLYKSGPKQGQVM